MHQKLVAHKACKFQSQGRLALPVLGIAHALRAIVVAKMLPEVEKVLQKLDEHGSHGPRPVKYKKGLGYYDDLTLRAF